MENKAKRDIVDTYLHAHAAAKADGSWGGPIPIT